MTCSSPFAYNDLLTYESQSYNIYFGESNTSVNGYSIPSSQFCLLGWNRECVGRWCYKCACGWKTCKCCDCDAWSYQPYWYDCWSTPAIPLWPSFDISASAGADIDFEIAAGYEISAEAPEGEPVLISSLTISTLDIDIDLSVDGKANPFSISLPLNLTIEENNFQIALIWPIDTLNYTYNESGVEFSINLTVSLEVCATPIPPVGWLNILLQFTMSAKYDDISSDSATTNFQIECPIISAEEGE